MNKIMVTVTDASSATYFILPPKVVSWDNVWGRHRAPSPVRQSVGHRPCSTHPGQLITTRQTIIFTSESAPRKGPAPAAHRSLHPPLRRRRSPPGPTAAPAVHPESGHCSQAPQRTLSRAQERELKPTEQSRQSKVSSRAERGIKQSRVCRAEDRCWVRVCKEGRENRDIAGGRAESTSYSR